MKRKLDIRLILVLLILSIMPLYLPLVVDSGVTASPRNPSTYKEMNTSWDSDYEFTWTSSLQTDPLPILNGSIIVGDHVVIRSTWNISVESSRISISHGFNETRNGTIEPPGTSDEWPVPLCPQETPSWETFDVKAGDDVRIKLNVSHNGDSAFAVFPWSDNDSDDEVDSEEIGDNSYIEEDIGGAGHAESGSYISPVSESIAVKILSWAWAYSENMTYELQVDNMWSLDLDSEHSNPAEVEFDTYNLLRNISVNLSICAWSGIDVIITEFVNVTFENFFAPIIEIEDPIELGSLVYNITWSATDLNTHDINYYSIWLSSDAGSTFQLLRQNLTTPFFVWDSTGFLLQEDYIVRIRAYSIDLTNPLCRVDNPPSSYWPGDYSDSKLLTIPGGDVTLGRSVPIRLLIDSPQDVTYTIGTTGHQIIWGISYPSVDPLNYQVLLNGSIYQSGYTENNEIRVSIDGLAIGVYEFEAIVGWSVDDSVTVQVVSEPVTEDYSLRTGLLTGISIGSGTIILISLVNLNRLVRKNRKKMKEQVQPKWIEDPHSILHLDEEDS